MKGETRALVVAISGPLAAIAGAALSAAATPLAGITSADGRYVALLLGAAVPLLAAYLVRPGATHRRLATLLALPWLFAIPFARSSIPVTWLTGSVLALGTEAIVHAARSVSRTPQTRPGRLASAACVALPLFYVLLALGVVAGNTQLAVVPVRVAHQGPRIGPHERAVTLETSDGYAIDGTYTPSEGRLGVVLVHGVSDGRDRWIGWARRLRAAGARSLRIDQRAHGTSDGAVCTYGQRERADVIAAAAFVRGQPGVSRLAVVGTSMGGGTVLAASRDVEADAIVLLAPASSYTELVASRTAVLGPLAGSVLAGSAFIARAVGQTPMTRWRPSDRMAHQVPILVFHGRDDAAIPIAMSRRLAAAHPNVTLVELAGVGHDETPDAVAEREWATVDRFLDPP